MLAHTEPCQLAVDEATRLKILNLYGLLDTPPEQEFDDLANLAAQICQAPIALLTLVDRTRLWFKAAVGTDMSELPRQGTFCAYAIEQAATFIVEDASTDPRFCEMPLIKTSPFLRFYAGVSLASREGARIGTICVMDVKSRKLTSDQLSGLERLGRHACRVLEIRRSAIEKQKSAQLELADLKRLNQLVLNAAGEGIYGVDVNGRATFVNPAAAHLLGYAPEEMMAKDQHALIHHTKSDGTPYPKEECPILTSFRDGEVHKVDSELFWRKDGTSFPVEYISTPILDEGKIKGAVVVFQDITERKKAQQSLLEMKEAAEAANRAKSQFLANMSHEIRSPMNSVLGYADLLLDKEISDQDRLMYASRIKSSGEHLLYILDDILDLTKVEFGQLRIETRCFSLTNVVTDCLQSMQPLIQRQQITLKVEFETPVPRWIESDSVRLRQVLMNLMGNAVKFTEKGIICIRLRSDDPTQITFEVEDSGIGISPEKQAQLFQPFSQADSSITRKFGGTGLGLYLSRRLTHALGGDLGLKWSEPGKGSCFTFTIKTIPVPNNQLIQSLDEKGAYQFNLLDPAELPSQNLEILLVEDSPDNQALMKLYLRKAKAKVDIADNGRSAVEMASQHEYDMILMDVMMPIMDGIEATKILRSQGYKKPIVILSAHAFREEVEKSYEAGGDAHLAKPVQQKELLRLIRHFTEPTENPHQQQQQQEMPLFH